MSVLILVKPSNMARIVFGQLIKKVTNMRFALTVLFGLAVTPALAQSREVQVRQMEARFYQAFLDRDSNAFERILADDFHYQHGSGATFSEKQFVDLIRSGAAIVTRADAPQMTVRDYGDVVVTYGAGPVDVSMGDKKLSGVLRFVNVWHRTGENSWELDHRNSEFLP
jgi:hypothetical protein